MKRQALRRKAVQKQATDAKPEGITTGQQQALTARIKRLSQPGEKHIWPIGGLKGRRRKGLGTPALEISVQAEGGRNPVHLQQTLLPTRA